MNEQQIKALQDYTNVLVQLIGTAYREGREDDSPFNQDTIQDDFTKTQTYKILKEMDKAAEAPSQEEKPKVKTKNLPVKGLVQKDDYDKDLFNLACKLKREDNIFAHASRKIIDKSDLVWFYKQYVNNLQKTD
jgi:hypothetical protein